MDIKGHIIDGKKGAFIIAEVAQAHDGSLGIAHSYIDAVADAGAHAIKFQTHIANAESTKDEDFRVPMSGQDITRWDYWKRMEFSKEQWFSLAKHSEDRGLVFLSSPFSVEAVNLLSETGMPAWKVGSGEFANSNLISAMLLHNAPILLSTGLCSYKELDGVHYDLKKCGAEFAFFQCTSSYPVSLEKVGINVLQELRDRYHCCVGLSDHSGTVYPSLAAMSESVDFIEVHVTFNKNIYGPDTSSSINLDDLEFLVKANQAFSKMRANPISKDLLANELNSTRRLFTKSLCLVNSLLAGESIEYDNLTLKKPGTGIDVDQIADLVGKTVLRDVSSDRLIKWTDINK